MSEGPDFSLVTGGPLYGAYRRARILRPPLDLLTRRIVGVSLFAWLPMLALAILDGRAVDGSVAVPFIRDISAHVRFLVALPLLIAAESVVHERLRRVLSRFIVDDVVSTGARAAFEGALERAVRLRDSVVVEVLLLAGVFIGTRRLWESGVALQSATWYATPGVDGLTFTTAGLWYSWVSVPLFQFLILRWLYRIVVWWLFLHRVSRLPLRIVATHPDGAGGLGFLGQSTHAFAYLLSAQSAVLAGTIADRVVHEGDRLADFKVEIAGAAVLCALQALGPLLSFAGPLIRAKKQAQFEYGGLCSRYVAEFDRKWLRGGAAPGEPLMGSADIQSLADLNNSFDVVRRMRVVPFGRNALIMVIAAVGLPLLPLVFTVVSPAEFFQGLVRYVL